MKFIKCIMIIGCLVLCLSGCDSKPAERSHVFEAYLTVGSEPNRYTPTMSVVPGLPIDLSTTNETIENYRIEIEVKNGVIFHELETDYKKTVDLSYEDMTVYWSPIIDEVIDNEIETDNIDIRLYDEAGFLVTSNTYQIVKDQEGFYALVSIMFNHLKATEPVEAFEDLSSTVADLESQVLVLEGENQSLNEQLETLTVEFDAAAANEEVYLNQLKEATIDGYETIYDYVLMPGLSAEDILSIHFDACQKGNWMLCEATFEPGLRNDADLVVDTGLVAATIVEMETTKVSPDNELVIAMVESGMDIEFIQAVTVVYNGDFDENISFENDGLHVVEYLMGRNSALEPWLIYYFDYSSVHETTKNLMEKYKDDLADGQMTIDGLKGLIEVASDYNSLIKTYVTYEDQFSDIINEKYAQKMYLLYNEDQLAGMFPHLSKLTYDQSHRHAELLVTQMHFIEGFETIGQIVDEALITYEGDASVADFVASVHWWMIELDDVDNQDGKDD